LISEFDAHRKLETLLRLLGVSLVYRSA
jgi:hypothetical protein